MSQPRVVSLLPSATEIVCTVGGGPFLVARSHECDYPAEYIKDVPAITAAANGHFTTSREVHDATTNAVKDGKSLYSIDAALLKEVKPTLMVTQDVCEVCAVSLDCVSGAIYKAGLDPAPQVITLGAHTLDGILTEMQTVADAIGQGQQGAQVVGALRARLQRAKQLVAEFGEPKLKKVVFLEWTDPLFHGGHWTPALIEMAGGVHPLNPVNPATGAANPSTVVTPEQVVEVDPDVVIVCPCGLDLELGGVEAGQLVRHEWWRELRAVKEGRVFQVDGNQHFNRPGPRLVDAFEWLVAVLHDKWELMPEGFPWKLLPNTLPPLSAPLAKPAQPGATCCDCDCGAAADGAHANGDGEAEEADETDPRVLALAGCSTPNLTPEMEDLYAEAVIAGRDNYRDPATGYSVFTEAALSTRGTCCGNRCRHCPFGHFKVARRGPRINRITQPMFMVWGASFSLPPSTLLLPVDASHAPPPSASPAAASTQPVSALESTFTELRSKGHESISVVVAVDPRGRDLWQSAAAAASTSNGSSSEASEFDRLTTIMERCVAAKVNMIAVPVPPQGSAKRAAVAQGVCAWVLQQALSKVPEGMAVEGLACMPGCAELPVAQWVAGSEQAGSWAQVAEAAGLKLVTL